MLGLRAIESKGKDNASYFSNQLIEACFVLKSPDSQHDRERLATAGHKGQTNVQVQYLSDRDEFHGMTNVTLREELVSYDERLPDVLERIDMKAKFGASRDHWCDATLGVSISVASIHSQEQGAMDAILRYNPSEADAANATNCREHAGYFGKTGPVCACCKLEKFLKAFDGKLYSYKSNTKRMVVAQQNRAPPFAPLHKPF